MHYLDLVGALAAYILGGIFSKYWLPKRERYWSRKQRMVFRISILLILIMAVMMFTSPSLPRYITFLSGCIIAFIATIGGTLLIKRMTNP